MAEKAETPVTEQETSSETGEETELKKGLQRLVKVILEEDDCGIDTVIKAIRILYRLMEMKLYQSVGIVSRSGQEQILRWCEEHGVTPPKVDHGYTEKPKTETPIVTATDIDEPVNDQCLINSLLEKLSSSFSDQKEGAKELHRLTKTMASCRAVFSEIPDGISRLLSPLSVTKVDSHPELQADLITTVLNISTVDNNKKLVAEHPVVIPLLAASMRSGTLPTKRNAAAALFALSTLDSNKLIIGNSQALVPLLGLLRVGHPLAAKDAVSAIFSLCHVHENIVKFTEKGIVKVILQKVSDGILVQELLGLLSLLTQHQDAMNDLEDPTTFHMFLQITGNYRSGPAKQSINAILYNICSRGLKQK